MVNISEDRGLRNTKGTRVSDAELDLLLDILHDENQKRRLPMSLSTLMRMLMLEAAEARGYSVREDEGLVVQTPPQRTDDRRAPARGSDGGVRRASQHRRDGSP